MKQFFVMPTLLLLSCAQQIHLLNYVTDKYNSFQLSDSNVFMSIAAALFWPISQCVFEEYLEICQACKTELFCER